MAFPRLHFFVFHTSALCMVIAGMSCHPCMPNQPDGAIAQHQYNRLAELYKKLVLPSNPPVLLVVGHAGGDYRCYPYDADDIGVTTCEISDTISRSLIDVGLDGVELDVQLDSMGVVRILHNEPETPFLKYGRGIQSYLEHNSLERIVDAFASDSAYQSKTIYLEIKAPNSNTLDGGTRKLLDATLLAINSTLSKYPNKDLVKSRIALASFNIDALMHAKGSGHKLYYIVGANDCGGFLYRNLLCREVSYLDDESRQKAIEFGQLSGIWFDPWHLRDAARVFNSINEDRLKRGNKPIEFFVSTYKMKIDEFAERYQEEVKDLRNVVGIIVDIDTSKQ